MDLTKEQLDEIVAAVKEKVNTEKKDLVTKDEMVRAITAVAEKIPSSTDTSKLATKAELKTLGDTLTASQETEIKKVNEDLKEVIKKVMPDAPKSSFWLFD